MINILILSAGTRNKIIQYFKQALTSDDGSRIGYVIATDMTSIAPAVYDADRFYQVPKITAPEYLDEILKICVKEKICAVLSLIDPELSLLAINEKKFADIGVKVIGSSYDLCEMSLDKMRMYNWLTDHGYPTAKSYTNQETFLNDLTQGMISFPVFIKPVKGSASISISKAFDYETVQLLFSHGNQNLLMIQEFLNGQEIGADVYIDMISGEVVSIFTKKKILMRAGETDKSVSFKDAQLFSQIEQFVTEAGYRGQIDIDIFNIDGKYYISEVNPRFGGGYPHAYECGCNHMKLIINNLLGSANKKNIGHYEEGIYMMKYNDVCIRKL